MTVRILVLIIAGLFCLARPASLTGQNEWERMGLVIASKSGLAGDVRLKYSYNDGNRLKNILEKFGKVNKKGLWIIKTESATELRSKLKTISFQIQNFKKQGKKVFLQVYYSGHGAASHFHIGGERISFKEVKNLLGTGNIEAKVFVLDVCYGASFFASKGFSAAKPVPLEINVDDMTQGEVVITSSALEEQAYEVKPLEGSIFSSHWMMALRGAGDKDKDGQVSLFEAYNYSHDKTVTYSEETLNKSQHPHYDMNLTGGKDLMLTSPVEFSTGILFKDCPRGNFSIINTSKKTNLGEVYIPGEGDFSLALERDGYEIRHLPAGSEPRKIQVQLAQNDLTPVHYKNFKTITPRKVPAKGAPDPGQTPRDAVTGEKTGDPQGSVLGNLFSPGDHQGISVSTGGGLLYFGERTMVRQLDNHSNLESAFGLSGNITHPSAAWHSELVLQYHNSSFFSAGLRLQFSERSFTAFKRGREILGGPDTDVPVTVESEYDISNIEGIPFIQIMPLRRGNLQLGFDVGVIRSLTTLDTRWTLNRPLYDYKATAFDSYSGEGWGVNTGVLGSWVIPRFVGSIAAEISFRLAGYYKYTEIYNGNSSETGIDSFNNDEWGITNTVYFSLSRIGWR